METIETVNIFEEYEKLKADNERLRETLQNIVDLKGALETSVWTISDFARAALKEGN